VPAMTRIRSMLVHLSISTVLMALGSAPIAAAAVPTPESFLGHRVGADGKLADYGQIVRYLETLDRESDRLTLHRLGKSTLGRELVMATISSEANLRDIDAIRATARRLADPRDLSPGDAERLIANGKAIVLVTCNIHSSEIGASQMAMEWAHRLVTTQDVETLRWLDDVVLLLMPSINPDGTDMIVDYYRKYSGTEWEGGRLPWIYHHYAGHDNNRDWYMLNLVETRIVNRVLHHDWFPQVFLDEHQMGNNTPRIFVPPYADPHTPLVHPLQWRLNDLVGTHMALRLEQAGKSGVIDSYSYDAYWPGGTKNTACLKNVVGLLTETASCRIASPVYVDPSELAGGRKGLPDYRAQMNFPNPWPGGWWRLRDIVDYELIVSNSLLETCSRHRADILRSFYVMGSAAVEQGASGSPYAYVIPAEQHDPAAAAQLVEILRENGLEAKVAKNAIDAGGRRFEKGSVVFLAAQPYRPFLVEMMERQRYPEVRQGPDTKEIFRPYDVTAWTLPLLMGVDWERVDKRFDLIADDGAPLVWKTPKFPERAEWLALPAESNQSFTLVNRLLASGVKVERLTGAALAEGTRQALLPGAFLVPGEAVAKLRGWAAERSVEVHAFHPASDTPRARLRAPRLALYKPWTASIDEGWTRLVLDRHEFKYTSLDNAAMKQKGLGAKYDVIVLADGDKSSIVDGKPRPEEGQPTYFEPLPPPYAGGIGKEGVENLKTFVEQGGTLVCLGASSAIAIEEMNLPVRDIVAKAKNTEFSVPGTLVNLVVDPSQPIGYGMPEHCAAYATGGPVFATSVPGAGVGREVVARYPGYADQVVASGWADGTDRMAGRSAIVDLTLGKGRVVLFGPRIQYRGQTVGTFKLLFNAIYRGVMSEQSTAVARGKD
jgi:hypothetical protein